MFLHLGIDKVVPLKKVIAILDVKIINSDTTGEYIDNVRKNKRVEVINVSESSAKSFVITDEAVYFSAISPQTLRKRAILF